ncbi:hypothetical protein DHEL01_v209175 [Diaporthe helianthi]|uniref:Uncharacterized protein n=1 Tax=Diaporthe helianthi TaxID=158607 RepID=A0A2P5HQC8_DIAHE|nr:hypothetical protein DHEL01_v209175 [Diaporthe helianthi]
MPNVTGNKALGTPVAAVFDDEPVFALKILIERYILPWARLQGWVRPHAFCLLVAPLDHGDKTAPHSIGLKNPVYRSGVFIVSCTPTWSKYNRTPEDEVITYGEDLDRR